MSTSIETSRVLRILRKIRSKLQAITSACEAEPTTYSQFTRSIPASANSSNVNKLIEPDMTPPAKALNVVYGGRKRRFESTSSLGVETQAPLKSVILGHSFSTPVKRKVSGFQDSFHEVLRTLWNSREAGNDTENDDQKIENDISSDNTIPDYCRKNFYTLAEISAFAVAKNAPKTREESVEDFVIIEEEWYNKIPEFRRTNVLLQHVANLCVDQIQTIGIFGTLIDVCIEEGAQYQAYEFLKHLVRISPPTEIQHYEYYYSIAICLNCPINFTKFLAHNLPASSFSLQSFDTFANKLPQEQSIMLFASSVTKLLDPGSESELRSITWRFRVDKWIQKLLDASKVSDNPKSPTNLSLRNVACFSADMEETTLVCLLLRNIQLSLINPFRFAYENQIRSWGITLKEKLKSSHREKLLDFIFAEKYNSTKRELNKLKFLVEGIRNYFENGLQIAAQLLSIMKMGLSEKNQENDAALDWVSQSLSEFESEIRTSQQEEWRFEPMLDAWVEKTPVKISQKLNIRPAKFNDFDSECESSDDCPFSSPSVKRRRISSKSEILFSKENMENDWYYL
ncbi:hypothetical protein HK096_005264 [Nowakowskiella sp. JEL0078]|nr:hypothetical protein HK096_005264 [Nowakowskiella sp. JEL0078]